MKSIFELKNELRQLLHSSKGDIQVIHVRLRFTPRKFPHMDIDKTIPVKTFNKECAIANIRLQVAQTFGRNMLSQFAVWVVDSNIKESSNFDKFIESGDLTQ